MQAAMVDILCFFDTTICKYPSPSPHALSVSACRRVSPYAAQLPVYADRLNHGGPLRCLSKLVAARDVVARGAKTWKRFPGKSSDTKISNCRFANPRAVVLLVQCSRRPDPCATDLNNDNQKYDGHIVVRDPFEFECNTCNRSASLFVCCTDRRIPSGILAETERLYTRGRLAEGPAPLSAWILPSRRQPNRPSL